jgi:hypothetical protein
MFFRQPLSKAKNHFPLANLLKTVEKKAADVVLPWDFFKPVERYLKKS